MALLASWGSALWTIRLEIGKKIISHKYNWNSPNIYWSCGGSGSTFWKSITWDLSGAKIFYKWKLGNGESIGFWHDVWAGDCSLKVQF